MSRKETPLIVLLALVLGLLGLAPLADHMTQRVLLQVSEISWLEFFRPFKNPPPMDAWGVRPISVFILKIYELFFGSISAPPQWALLARSTGILVFFGLASRRYLENLQFSRPASVLASISAMLLAPTLFSAWYLPEFDTLGAAATLYLAAMLQQNQPFGTLDRLLLFPSFVVAFGLKESSALMAFAFIGSGLVSSLMSRARKQAERHLWVLAVATLLWLLMAAPLMRMQNGNATMSNTTWLDRLPILEHNLAQYIYLLSAPGAALIGAAFFKQQLTRYKLESFSWVSSALLLGLLLASPLVVFYSHYEAIYYAPRYFPLGFGLVLVGVLAANWWLDPQAARAQLARNFFAAHLIYGGALMASPSAREDLASRIFLAMAPLLHALAWEAAFLLWNERGRWLHRVLVLCFAWYPVGQAINFAWDWQARQRIEYKGRSKLASLPLERSIVLFNHYVQLVGAYELLQFGAPDLRDKTMGGSSDKSATFLQVTAWPGNFKLPSAYWGVRMNLEDMYSRGQRYYLYWLTPRSTMPQTVNTLLQGDLSWTRRPYGLFTPYDYQPGWSPSIPQEDLPVNNGAQAWNRMEETRITTYAGTTPFLKTVFSLRGKELHQSKYPYYQLPLHLTEIPLRLLLKIPLIESYQYEQSIYEALIPGGSGWVPPPSPPPGPPGGPPGPP